MEYGGSSEIVLTKNDPCGVCGKRTRVSYVRSRRVNSGFIRSVLE